MKRAPTLAFVVAPVFRFARATAFGRQRARAATVTAVGSLSLGMESSNLPDAARSLVLPHEGNGATRADSRRSFHPGHQRGGRVARLMQSRADRRRASSGTKSAPDVGYAQDSREQAGKFVG